MDTKLIGKFLYLFFLLFTIYLFVLAKYFSGDNLSLNWLVVSQLSSLIGTALLALSFLLSGRFRFLEDFFGGLDKVYKLHHISGGLSFILLLHHPIFLIFDNLPDTRFVWKYLYLSTDPAYNWGVLALYFMILMLVLTLFINLPYALWKKTHEFMGLTLIFASLHILTISSDVKYYLPLRWWFIFLIGVSIYSAIYRRFIYNLYGPKFRYRLKSIESLQKSFVMNLEPVSKRISFWPGQFIFLKFDDLPNQSHPFSIAGVTSEGYLRIGVKILGKYTSQMATLNPNSLATIWGAYGKFWEGLINKKELILIGGGIGITPILSMLNNEVKSNSLRKVNLFYCVHDEKEAIFNSEILNLIKNSPNIKYTLYSSEKEGRISASKISEVAGGTISKKVLICGPNKMMYSLANQFKKLGIKNKDLVFEDFNFK